MARNVRIWRIVVFDFSRSLQNVMTPYNDSSCFDIALGVNYAITCLDTISSNSEALPTKIDIPYTNQVFKNVRNSSKIFGGKDVLEGRYYLQAPDHSCQCKINNIVCSEGTHNGMKSATNAFAEVI